MDLTDPPRLEALNQPLGFGRYRKRTWLEIPDDYLRWLEANCTDWLNATLARMELARRQLSED